MVGTKLFNRRVQNRKGWREQICLQSAHPKTTYLRRAPTVDARVIPAGAFSFMKPHMWLHAKTEARTIFDSE